MKMCKTIVLLLMFVNANLIATTIVAGYWNGDSVQYYEQQVALGLEKGKTEGDVEDYLDSLGADILLHFRSFGLGLIKLPSKLDLFDYIDTLENHPAIKFAEPSLFGYYAATNPNDEYYADSLYQWPLRNTGQPPTYGTEDADIDANLGWDYEKDAESVLVAILDSGIPTALDDVTLIHEDLDDTTKILFGISTDPDMDYLYDESGHGTHVAGIIAAEPNNSVGIAGIIDKGQVLIIKVGGGLGGSQAYLAAGINYAVDYADTSGHKLIINASLAYYAWNEMLETAVIGAHEAGALQVFCAGNDSIDKVALPALYAFNNAQSEFPGGESWLGYESVISVAATDKDDERPSYSNYDTDYIRISLAAPGGGEGANTDMVFSCLRDTTYGWLSGTSMATPHVSGLAALAWERFPSLDATEIRTLLEKASEDVNGGGEDKELGHGRINAYYTLAPPSAPQNLAISGDEDDHPLLDWDANDEPDLVKYNIYKKESTGYWFKFGSVSSPTTQWEDGSCTIGGRFDPLLQYKITAEDYTEQESGFSNTVSSTYNGTSKEIAGSDPESNNLPTKYNLSEAYPNPFNPSTTFSYDLPKTTDVEITIYNLAGHAVWTYKEVDKSAGFYSLEWSGIADGGNQVPSGVYLISFVSPDFRAVQKAVLVK